MNYTTARCGCQVIAAGAPGSMARQACERLTCGKPRCVSGLPAKFTDRECAAYVWMFGRGFAWMVDHVDKSVWTEKHKYPNLIEFATYHGWDG